MRFQPEEFIGRPLVELMDAVRTMSADQLIGLNASEVRLHQPRVDSPTIDGDTCLPADHPNVEVPGVILERYLGGGGQGCVFAGRIVATGKIVAVKVLAPSVGALRGVREALLTARVRHPHVLRVLRSQPVGGCWVVVMELVLGDALADGHQLGDMQKFFHQLASAVAAVAAARLVHRDVKPANVLVRRADGTPVLVDFGLAVDLGSPAEEIDEISGTPFFLPPEAWRHARPDSSWDAYSLGVTAAVVLGTPADLPHDLGSLRRAKLLGEFDRTIANMVSAVESPLRQWVSGLLQSDASRRLDVLHRTADWLAA